MTYLLRILLCNQCLFILLFCRLCVKRDNYFMPTKAQKQLLSSRSHQVFFLIFYHPFKFHSHFEKWRSLRFHIYNIPCFQECILYISLPPGENYVYYGLKESISVKYSDHSELYALFKIHYEMLRS
jgi:hypothetical protein